MKLLLLVTSILLVANVAMADHIGIYTDATGSSCQLAPGFTTSPTVIQMLNPGSVGSQFAISAANAPGSTILAFSSPYQSVCVNPPCPFLYGGCLSGSIVIGTITAILGSTGYIEIIGAGTNPTPLVVGCNNAVQTAFAGQGWLSPVQGECPPGALPTESSTWGSVKALYR